MKTFGISMVVAALSGAASARVGSQQPQMTATVELPLDGMSPKPTQFAALNDLRRRRDSSDYTPTYLVAPDETCGFIDGRAGAPFTCGVGASCVFSTSASGIQGFLGCCEDARGCAVVLDCIDYDSYYSSSACDDGCVLDYYTLKCTSKSAKYCNSVSFDGGVLDYWCNNVDITGFQSATTELAGDPRKFSTSLGTDTSTSVSFTGTDEAGADPTASLQSSDLPTTTASSGSSDDGDSGSDGDSDNNNDSGSDSDDDDGGSSTPTGAIAGGVVGGVAAVGLGGLGLFFFLRNKKKKQAAAASGSDQSQAPYNPPVQQAPPQQGYNGYYNQQPGYGPPGQQQPYPPQGYPPNAGGFYPGTQPSPDPHSATSPTMSSMTDPRMSQAHPSTSPAPSHTPTMPGQQPVGGFQPQQEVIHEAPVNTNESHRGEMHELA